MTALLDGVADEAHAAEFAGDEDPGHVGLEIRAEVRDVDSALLGAENERDGVERTGLAAGAVSDAVSRLDELGLAVDHADDVAFGAGADTGATGETFPRVEDRMKRRRLHESGLHRRSPDRPALRLTVPAPQDVEDPDEPDRHSVDDRDRRNVHPVSGSPIGHAPAQLLPTSISAHFQTDGRSALF